MPIPPLVASGQIIAASHVNGIRNFLPLMADGTAGTPGLRFEDDPDTGFHRPGSNQLAIVTGGAVRAVFDSSGEKIVGARPMIELETDTVTAKARFGSILGNYASIVANLEYDGAWSFDDPTKSGLALIMNAAAGVMALRVANPGSDPNAGWTSSPFEATSAEFKIGTPALVVTSLPSSNPGAGTKQLWYDPADGNRVKFAA
jgi:hypothetical protein